MRSSRSHAGRVATGAKVCLHFPLGLMWDLKYVQARDTAWVGVPGACGHLVSGLQHSKKCGKLQS